MLPGRGFSPWSESPSATPVEGFGQPRLRSFLKLRFEATYPWTVMSSTADWFWLGVPLVIVALAAIGARRHEVRLGLRKSPLPGTSEVRSLSVGTAEDTAANLRAMLHLSSCKISDQVLLIQALEAKALASLGICFVLVGLVVASQTLEGRRWWAALPGLVVSIVSFLIVLADRQFYNGPAPGAFYERFGGAMEVEASEQLLSDLQAPLDNNAMRIRSMVRQINISLVLLTVTITYSLCLFHWNR